MFGRFLLAGIAAVATGTTAFAAGDAISGSVETETVGRLRISCIGTMLTSDQPSPGSRTLADGMIDFAARRVLGFGFGSQPMSALTAATIDFGSAAAGGGSGTIIEGSIDRQSGHTRIVVREPRHPEGALIDLRLDCKFEQPVS